MTETLGERLKETREEKGLSIEQVSRDTNISRSYIADIEVEDFSNFPGETYVIGFIRNYAQYLGHDGPEFIQLYKNLVIQEQPLPLEELVSTKSIKPSKRPLLITLISIASIVGIAFIFITLILMKIIPIGFDVESKLPLANKGGGSYEFNGDLAEFSLKRGNHINLTELTSGEDFTIIAEGGSGESDKEGNQEKVYFRILGAKSNKSSFREVQFGKRILIDLNEDGRNDVELFLKESKDLALYPVILNRKFSNIKGFNLKDPLISESAIEAALKENSVGFRILESNEIKPFSIQLTKGQGSFIQYKIDGKATVISKEKQLLLNATTGALFWLGNKNGAQLIVNKIAVDLSFEKGFSAAFFIAWKEAADGKGFDLGAYPLDGTDE